MFEQPISEQQVIKAHKTSFIASYALMLLGLSFLPLMGMVFGVAIAYNKRSKVFGTFYFEHCTWIIRSFWLPVGFSLGFLFMFPLLLLPFFHFFLPLWLFIAPWWFALLFLWSFSRFAWGLIRLIDNEGIPKPFTWFF